jgi:heme/copper-type cytochrome/quinol oxidase subunit 2
MHHWMNDSGWLWMSFMMVFLILVIGAVVYAAVRLAQRPPRQSKS